VRLVNSLRDVLRYLAVRITDEQQIIANLVTADSGTVAGPDVVAIGPHHG